MIVDQVSEAIESIPEDEFHAVTKSAFYPQ